jgi:hypothetical protein
MIRPGELSDAGENRYSVAGSIAVMTDLLLI